MTSSEFDIIGEEIMVDGALLSESWTRQRRLRAFTEG